MQLIADHPAAFAIMGYWLFSAFAGGMPAPTERSGVAYIWLHNSLQILAGNLTKAVAVRYPEITVSTVPKMQASGEIGTLWLFFSANASYFAALRHYFAARFPLRQPSPASTLQRIPTHFTEPGALMSTAAATAQPNGFIRFIDAIGKIFVKAAPVAVEVAEEAEPILALTPAGPEYQVAVTAIANAQQLATASIAAGTNLTGEQKLQIAVAAATPAISTILTSKGVTTDHASHITNFIQAIFGILAGPVSTIAKTVSQTVQAA